jgi:hypothetical protein
MAAGSPFKKNVAIGLGILTAVSFVTGLLFAMLGGDVKDAHSRRTDTFSRSAVGHRALIDVLRAANVPVSVSRARTAQKAGSRTVLLLIEPQRDAGDPTADNMPALLRDSGAEDIIVVLPKWEPFGYHARQGWIRSVDPVPPDRIRSVLKAAHVECGVRDGDGQFTEAPFEAPTPTLDYPQVLEGVTPIVGDGVGALVGQTQAYGKRVWIISDPDVLNNAGLFQGENARFVLALLAHIVGDRALVIDETLHGFSIVEGVWPRLFEFPLVLTTLQVGLVLALLLWAGMRRFGPPAADVAELGRGRAALISNTARLLWYGGHSAAILDQFWRATVRTVRQGLHAPPQLEGAALWQWLDRVGKARGIQQSAADLADEVARITDEDGARILQNARRIARWQALMLGREASGPS